MRTCGIHSKACTGLFWLGVTAAQLSLGACGEAYQPETVRATADRNEVATVDVSPWPGEQAIQAGEWRPTTVDGRAALDFFGQPGTQPPFRLACDERGGIVLERRGLEAAGGLKMMQVTANGQVARLAVNQPDTQTPILRAAIPPTHELMAALAPPRGQLTVHIGSEPQLVLPLGPVTAALATTCRSPDPAEPA